MAGLYRPCSETKIGELPALRQGNILHIIFSILLSNLLAAVSRTLLCRMVSASICRDVGLCSVKSSRLALMTLFHNASASLMTAVSVGSKRGCFCPYLSV